MINLTYPFEIHWYRKTISAFGFKTKIFPWFYVIENNYCPRLLHNYPFWYVLNYSKFHTREDNIEDWDEYDCMDVDYEEDYYCYEDDYNFSCEEDEDIEEESSLPGIKIYSLVLTTDNWYILASEHMLIADVDCADVVEPELNRLQDFVNQNGGCFKVYKTLNGLRYIQTDLLYQKVNKGAIDTLLKLNSDPKYIKMCEKEGQFRARLTPKLSQNDRNKYLLDLGTDKEMKVRVCDFLGFYKRDNSDIIVQPCLDEALEKHDYFTRSSEKTLILA